MRGTPLAQIDAVPLSSSANSSVPAPVPIAVVMSSFAPGGTENQMIELVRRLDRSRWHVHVAALRRSGDWLDRVRAAAPTTMFPIDSFLRPQVCDRVRTFVNWCRTERIAVVHTVDMPSNIFGLPAAALAGVPVRVGSRRELRPGRTGASLATQRLAYGFAHRIVANARAAAGCLRAERVPDEKITIIPNGLDLELFHRPQRKAARRRVMTVANLRPEKGHDVLLAAAPIVLQRFPDARFDLVGGGTERERLQTLADTLGVSGATTFHGHQENVAARLAAADIFVLPSRTEAFPNALLEAMAAGLPIVASAVGGIVEAIQDGRTGLLVSPGDAEALAACICRLMADPERAASLGAAARAQAEARYSFDRMVAAFDRLYVSELTRRGFTAAPAPQLAAS